MAGTLSGEQLERDALRDFFETSSLGLAWLTPDGTVVHANRAQLQLAGRDSLDYIGRHIADSHAEPAAIDAALNRVRRGESVEDLQVSLRRPDGSPRAVSVSASARFEGSELRYIRWVTRDATPLQAAKRAQIETEALYRSLLGVMPALIVTTTPDGQIEGISEGYEAYTGLTLEEAQDWERHAVIHADDLPRAMQMWGAALASGEPMQNEMRLRRHDGAYRWYLVQAAPVRDPSGEILRWVTVNLDIDDRKRAEAHDRYLAQATASLISPLESPDMLAAIARLAVPLLADVCAIGLFDGTNRTVRVETAMVDESQAADVAAVHLRAWRASAASPESVSDVINRGESVYVADCSEEWIRTCAPDEEQMRAARLVAPRSLVCVPLVGRGQVIGMATFATTRSGRTYEPRDHELLCEIAGRLSITLENIRLYEEVRAKADELDRANAAKDEFLSLVSHELRTPLTTIRGNAELLVRSHDRIDEESRRRALLDVASDAARLQRIIDNLLLLARLEQDRVVSEPSLAIDAVHEVVARHGQTAPQRRFVVRASNKARPVSFPEGYLQQVIENLVTNAEKYSPADSPIEIDVERTDTEVTVRVLDGGDGVPEEDAERVFEPFFRSASSAGAASGLGIGLAVCKRLVEAQGGKIWSRRRTDGRSEFGFSLPALESEPETQTPGAEAGPA